MRSWLKHECYTTAGPFALYGNALVDACVRFNSYVDISGETPWVRTLIDRYHAQAASGTRIIPCCGFDSVPSDLGTWSFVTCNENWMRLQAGECLFSGLRWF